MCARLIQALGAKYLREGIAYKTRRAFNEKDFS